MDRMRRVGFRVEDCSSGEGALYVVYCGQTCPIDAGTSDDVDVWRVGDELWILSHNSRLGYVGLEVYEWKGAARGGYVGDVFLQNDSDVVGVLGPLGVDLAPATMARRLRDYIA